MKLLRRLAKFFGLAPHEQSQLDQKASPAPPPVSSSPARRSKWPAWLTARERALLDRLDRAKRMAGLPTPPRDRRRWAAWLRHVEGREAHP